MRVVSIAAPKLNGPEAGSDLSDRLGAILPLAWMACLVLGPSIASAGLVAKVYESNVEQERWALRDGIIDFSNASLKQTRIDEQIDFWGGSSSRNRNDFYGVEWTGYLRIEEAGEYGIGTISDDGSQVWVDGELIVDNSERQWFDWEDNLTEGSLGQPPTGSLFLNRGFHRLRVTFYEDRYWDGIEFWWLPPGRGESRVPYQGEVFTNATKDLDRSVADTNWEIVPAAALYTEILAIDSDFNADGVVDAADYTVWRDALASGSPLPNDATPGAGPDDLARWREAYGALAGDSLVASGVPEPTSLVMLVVGVTLPIQTLRRLRALS